MVTAVLIVDDSLTVRMDLGDAFEAGGFRTVLCASGEEARTALAQDRFDVVILDVMLPDADGVELLELVHASPSGELAAVLLLSSEAEVKDRIRGLTRGADEYVGKPYDVGHVVSRAREILETRRRTKSDATRVLVIDDSPTFRQELRAAFESVGYEVLLGASGEEGLQIAATMRPDAIVVDGVLPGIDGSTVIRRIRLDVALRHVPCVLLTGSDDRNAELQALEAGADAFVRKDENVDIVQAKLAAVLRRSATSTVVDDTRSVLGPKKILAVDDSLTYLHTLADALRTEGYDVVLAHSGEEALELLTVQSVDCVLLDLMMPGIGGTETCQRIKSAPLTRDIPLIILTALDDREALIQGLSAGADDYISKTAELDVVKARVRAQIRRRQFEDENRRIREELHRREFEAAEARAASELSLARAELVKELEHKNLELEAFSYSVSHDLRAPLRSIHGFSRAVLEDYGDTLDDKGKNYLERVCAAAERMGELIDDLLQLSRVGRSELQRVSTNVSDLAQRVCDDLRSREPDRDVTVEVEPGLMAHADPRLVSVVLENLLGNSWKFTAKTPGARIVFRQETSDDESVFVVTDNGPGFDMKYAPKLFRPFQRLHSNTEFSGTGIGLATVQRVVNRHGGRVWAESALGNGAKFYFSLSKGTQ